MYIYLNDDKWINESSIVKFYRKIGINITAKRDNSASESKTDITEIIIESNNNNIYSLDMSNIKISVTPLNQKMKEEVVEYLTDTKDQNFNKNRTNQREINIVNKCSIEANVEIFGDDRKNILLDIFVLYLCKNCHKVCIISRSDESIVRDMPYTRHSIRTIFTKDNIDLFETELYKKLKKYQNKKINCKWLIRAYCKQIFLIFDVLFCKRHQYVVKNDGVRYGISNLTPKEKITLLIMDIVTILIIFMLIVCLVN